MKSVRSIVAACVALLTIALAAILPMIAIAQNASPPPPTAAASAEPAALRMAKTWFEKGRTADDPAFVSFVKRYWPNAPGAPESWLKERQNLRDLELSGAFRANATLALLWLRDPFSETYSLLTMNVAPDNPERITGMGFQQITNLPPGVAPPSKLQQSALIAATRAHIDKLVAADRFSGAILIAREGRILFQQAYGFADREARKPVTLETQLRFGSIGKVFTAVAIMQLVQDGKVDLAAPVGRYLADYPNRDIATKVTVAHLLSHTGGTGTLAMPDFAARKESMRDGKDFVAVHGARAPEFEPGSRMAYSNYGFILLGRIVEETSGLSYDDYLQRNIFSPAAMKSTGNLAEDVKLPRRAVAYSVEGTKVKRSVDVRPEDMVVRGTAAGAGYSTVGDFKRFMDALLANRLLRAATFRQLTTGGVTLPGGRLAPYDVGEDMTGAGRFIGHGGAGPGQSGMLLHFPSNGYTIIALANRDSPAGDGLAAFVARRAQ